MIPETKKPFDPEAKCPKCECEDVGTSHHRGAGYSYNCDWRFPNVEHMHRWCRRCHYEWVEAPLDAQKVQDG